MSKVLDACKNRVIGILFRILVAGIVSKGLSKGYSQKLRQGRVANLRDDKDLFRECLSDNKVEVCSETDKCIPTIY